MFSQRYLIVNADDFGFSPGVNEGIIQAHEQGIVTSASLMVRQQSAPAAAAYAREHPALSVGLHVDLAEWVYRDETWVLLYEVVSLSDATAVANEVSRQLDAFRRLVGRDPTHIDSHQHIHREEPLHSILAGVARTLKVPLRHYDPTVGYCGSFYGQTGKGEPVPDAIAVNGLIKTLEELPSGVTELGCHPGLSTDFESAYLNERATEVSTLCDPRVRIALSTKRIQLTSFHDLIGARPQL